MLKRLFGGRSSTFGRSGGALHQPTGRVFTPESFTKKKHPLFSLVDLEYSKVERTVAGFTEGNKISFFHYGNDVKQFNIIINRMFSLLIIILL